MPEKKKLALGDLKVQSFVTELGDEAHKVKGGESAATNCDPTCEAPLCDSINNCAWTVTTCPGGGGLSGEEESCEGECDG